MVHWQLGPDTDSWGQIAEQELQPTIRLLCKSGSYFSHVNRADIALPTPSISLRWSG